MAAALRKEAGTQVELIDGGKGELSVLVDGRVVAQKKGDSMPTADEILAALKEPAGTR